MSYPKLSYPACCAQPAHDTMDIISCYVSSPEMQPPSFAVYLWVSMTSVLSSVTEKLLSCFWSLLWVIIALHREELSDQLCSIWLIWAESTAPYTSQFIQLLLSAVTSSIKTKTRFHWQPHMLVPPPCFTVDVVFYPPCVVSPLSALFSSHSGIS